MNLDISRDGYDGGDTGVYMEGMEEMEFCIYIYIYLNMNLNLNKEYIIISNIYMFLTDRLYI